MGKFKEPKVGDKIYVPSSYYVYRGADDFEGGLATISAIKINEHLEPDHCNYIMVGINERQHTQYNYSGLMERQDELKEEYGDKIAHPCPDYSPEFNEDSGWR